MKTTINCSPMHLPFLAHMLQYQYGPKAVCICCVEEATGKPLAGVIYDAYNGAIVMAHIWVEDMFTPSRDWIAAIFDYPFNKLGVKKIIGQVNSLNEEAVRLDEHFGFELECKIPEFYEAGASLLVYSMNRSQCRVLNSPRWAKVVERVSRV